MAARNPRLGEGPQGGRSGQVELQEIPGRLSDSCPLGIFQPAEEGEVWSGMSDSREFDGLVKNTDGVDGIAEIFERQE